MKKLLFFFFTNLSCFSYVQAQINVSDDLSWGSMSQVQTQTSPDFAFCDQTVVNYTVSTSSSCGFMNIMSSGNPNIPNGLIFPAVTGSCSQSQIPISLNFSQPVSNLRVLLVDLDEDANAGLPNPEETVTNFSVAPVNVVPVTGVTTWNGTSVVPSGNNTDAWVEWDVDITSVSFTYTRPGSGYGLVIGGVEFSCDGSGGIVHPNPDIPGSPVPIDTVTPPQPPTSVDTTQNCISQIQMPNVFTPNGDMVNDVFKPTLDTCVTIVSTLVLNRWGELVFTTDSPNPMWTGRNDSGNPVSDGTYFWLIEYLDSQGVREKQHGIVMVIR